MTRFAVIEIEDGLAIVEVGPGQSAEDAAVLEGGILIDPGPFSTYEEANSAIDLLQEEDDDR